MKLISTIFALGCLFLSSFFLSRHFSINQKHDYLVISGMQSDNPKDGFNLVSTICTSGRFTTNSINKVKDRLTEDYGFTNIIVLNVIKLDN